MVVLVAMMVVVASVVVVVTVVAVPCYCLGVCTGRTTLYRPTILHHYSTRPRGTTALQLDQHQHQHLYCMLDQQDIQTLNLNPPASTATQP